MRAVEWPSFAYVVAAPPSSAFCARSSPQPDEHGAHGALLRSVARQCGADYVIRLGGPVVDRWGFVRAPGQGPVLTWHPLAPGVPGGRLDDWALTLGDIELF